MVLSGRPVGRRQLLLGVAGAAVAAGVPGGTAWAASSPPDPGRLPAGTALQWTSTAYDLVLTENSHRRRRPAPTRTPPSRCTKPSWPACRGTAASPAS